MTEHPDQEPLERRVRELLSRRPSGGTVWWAIEEMLDDDPSDADVGWWTGDDGPTISFGAEDDVVEFGLLDADAFDGWAAHDADGRAVAIGRDRSAVDGAVPDGGTVLPALSTLAVRQWLEDLLDVERTDLVLAWDPTWEHHVHPLAWMLERDAAVPDGDHADVLE